MDKTFKGKLVTDVTKFFEKEKTIDTSLEVFRIAVEGSPVPMVLHAEDGEVLLMSKSTLIKTGYSFDEINTTQKFTQVLHRAREDYNNEFIKRSFDDGVNVQGEEEFIYTKNGDKKIWAFYNTLLGVLGDGRKVMVTICVDVTEERKANKKLKRILIDNQRFDALIRGSIESQKGFDILLLDTEYKYLYFNSKHKEHMKLLYNSEIEVGKCVFDFMTKDDDIKKEEIRFKRAIKGESYSLIDIYGENHDQYFETFYNPIITKDGVTIGLSIFTSNITEKMAEIKRIKDSEEKYRLIYSSMSQGLAVHEIILDDKGKPIDYQYVEVNDSYLRLFGYERENLIGRRISDIVPTLEKYWIETFGNVALTGEPKYYENYSHSAEKHLSTYAYSPRKGQFAVLISDITDRIRRDNEIKYLSVNDQLTGLFNRRYYEEKLIELDKPDYYPLSLIMGDVNGLKLVNDSFGHQKGDELLIKVAQILEKSCRSTDVITRIGGDEFVIFLPNTDNNHVKRVVERINKYTSEEKLDAIDVSVSFGYGTKNDIKQSLTELFKNVEDDMYRNKINESRSMRGKTIDLIMNTLYEKNKREMIHSKRVGGYCVKFAEALGFDKEQVNQMRAAGYMHDIGKIGIDDRILDKEGSLTTSEYKEVVKHSETGYRILSSINEFSAIAQFVLEHHERVDGKGYPNGLKDKEISVQSKIINIVDSYDAMTGPRTYKDAMSKDEAIKELKRCSGTQFDAALVDVFIAKVLIND